MGLFLDWVCAHECMRGCMSVCVGVCMYIFVYIRFDFEPLFCYWGKGALEKGFIIVVIIGCVCVCMC